MKRRKVIAGAAAMLLLFTAGCGKNSQYDRLLDPSQPVTINVWHYYNGAQQEAFDSLVEKFNETEGRKRGIFVEEHSQGSVTQLDEKVSQSLNKEVGSSEMPDIFSAYADTAYMLNKQGALASLDTYITETEQEAYVQSFLEEGKIGENGELIIFPVAKSSEIFMMNKTDWDKFAAATGAVYEDLKTMEGVAETARSYYEWTDSLTPDVPGDGKAFFGRDAMANLFYIGTRQLGKELVEVQPGKEPVLHADRDIIRRIWDTWYVPSVKGYFGAYGRFRSDDVKTGQILAYTGSTSSAPYFPDQVETEEGISYPIEYVVLPAPVFADGEAYAIQQGAGMVVTKSTPQREYASMLFLKWFTEVENNLEFCVNSGYIPVKKEACTKERLDSLIHDKGISIEPKTRDAIAVSFEIVEKERLYANKAYENGEEVRKVLEYSMSDAAGAAAEKVNRAIADGGSLSEAAGPYTSDDAFSAWYEGFREAVRPKGPDGKGTDASITD